MKILLIADNVYIDENLAILDRVTNELHLGIEKVTPHSLMFDAELAASYLADLQNSLKRSGDSYTLYYFEKTPSKFIYNPRKSF